MMRSRTDAAAHFGEVFNNELHHKRNTRTGVEAISFPKSQKSGLRWVRMAVREKNAHCGIKGDEI